MPKPIASEIVTTILMFQLGCKRESITPDTNLEEDMGIDSLDCLEIVIQIENDYDLLIEDAELEQVKTVQDLITLVDKKQQEREAAFAADRAKEKENENPGN